MGVGPDAGILRGWCCLSGTLLFSQIKRLSAGGVYEMGSPPPNPRIGGRGGGGSSGELKKHLRERRTTNTQARTHKHTPTHTHTQCLCELYSVI